MPLHKLTENRKLKRYSARLKIFTQETGELIGYTDDIHTDGIKLKSKYPIPDKKVIHIWLDGSDEDKKRKGYY